MATPYVTWSAPEFRYYEKSARWYWASGVVAALAIGAALFQQNFLFAAFTLLAWFVIVAWARRKPRTVSFSLTDEGFNVDGKTLYPFGRLDGFAIVERTPNADTGELILRTKSTAHRFVRIMVPREHMEELRETLTGTLDEFTFEETFTEYLLHLFQF